MDPEHLRIIERYARPAIDLHLLRHLDADPHAAPMTTTVLATIRDTAEAIAETEHQLWHVADHIATIARRVADDLTPTAPRNATSLHRRGELQAQGVRFDTLTTERAERIRTLNTVLRLWRVLPAVAATLPPTQPTPQPDPHTRRPTR